MTVRTMYKSMHNMAPSYLSNIFQLLRDVHHIKLSDTSDDLRLLRVTMSVGLWSLFYQDAAIWNKLKLR